MFSHPWVWFVSIKDGFRATSDYLSNIKNVPLWFLWFISQHFALRRTFIQHTSLLHFHPDIQAQFLIPGERNAFWTLPWKLRRSSDPSNGRQICFSCHFNQMWHVESRWSLFGQDQVEGWCSRTAFHCFSRLFLCFLLDAGLRSGVLALEPTDAPFKATQGRAEFPFFFFLFGAVSSLLRNKSKLSYSTSFNLISKYGAFYLQ